MKAERLSIEEEKQLSKVANDQYVENQGLKVQLRALQDAVNELQSQLEKEREDLKEAKALLNNARSVWVEDCDIDQVWNIKKKELLTKNQKDE